MTGRPARSLRLSILGVLGAWSIEAATSATAASVDDDEHLLESLGAIAMAFRCPRINIDFALSDRLWNDLRRRGVRFEEGHLDKIFMSKALDSERSIEAGNLDAYCRETERDYGPTGRLYPGLVVGRR